MIINRNLVLLDSMCKGHTPAQMAVCRLKHLATTGIEADKVLLDFLHVIGYDEVAAAYDELSSASKE
jgi:hypothetical protein